jgi:hypothetical protein
MWNAINFCSFLLFLISTSGLSQNIDSAAVDEGYTDTIVINKDPYILKKTIYVNTSKVKKVKAYFEIFFLPLYNNYNYFKVCQDCKDYLANLKQAQSKALSYSLGLNFIYSYKSFTIIPGLSFTTIREHFNFNGIKAINSFNYLESSLMLGFKINRKKVCVIPLIGPGISLQKSLRGKTISEQNYSEVVDIQNMNRFSRFSYTMDGGVKIIFNPANKFTYSIEPFYRWNLKTITRSNMIYVEQRNFIGLRFGIIYSL